MTVFATDTQRVSNLVKYEEFKEFRHCRDVIVVATPKAYVIGDLVTATGTVPATAADVYGIVVEDKTTTATNKQIVVLARGSAGVSNVGLKLGALTLANVKPVLLAKGIKVLTAV